MSQVCDVRVEFAAVLEGKENRGPGGLNIGTGRPMTREDSLTFKYRR